MSSLVGGWAYLEAAKVYLGDLVEQFIAGEDIDSHPAHGQIVRSCTEFPAELLATAGQLLLVSCLREQSLELHQRIWRRTARCD